MDHHPYHYRRLATGYADLLKPAQLSRSHSILDLHDRFSPRFKTATPYFITGVSLFELIPDTHREWLQAAWGSVKQTWRDRKMPVFVPRLPEAAAFSCQQFEFFVMLVLGWGKHTEQTYGSWTASIEHMNEPILATLDRARQSQLLGDCMKAEFFVYNMLGSGCLSKYEISAALSLLYTRVTEPGETYVIAACGFEDLYKRLPEEFISFMAGHCGTVDIPLSPAKIGEVVKTGHEKFQDVYHAAAKQQALLDELTRISEMPDEPPSIIPISAFEAHIRNGSIRVDTSNLKSFDLEEYKEHALGALSNREKKIESDRRVHDMLQGILRRMSAAD